MDNSTPLSSSLLDSHSTVNSSSSSSSISPSVHFNSLPGVPPPHPRATANTHNPVVFLDITISSEPVGRIVIELFSHLLPHTCELFRQYCTGEIKSFSSNQSIGYKGISINKVQNDYLIQCDSLFDENAREQQMENEQEKILFESEGFPVGATRAGLIGMAGKFGTNAGCPFFILCKEAPWLSGKHSIIGAVIEGMLTVRKIEAVPTVPGSDKPKLEIKIVECGEL
jgi:peptidyl-prolyl isomerase H (cyclophilin H)